MYLVGLTGGIATGKSTVADIIKEFGIPVIDADQIAREIVRPGLPAWFNIKKEFGEDMALDNGQGEINRKKLGAIIFSDKAKRKRLNEITHPLIMREVIKSCIALTFRGYPYVVLDLPLLFETGALVEWMHKIIVVTCEKDQQLQRLMERDKSESQMAQERIYSQMPVEEKAQRANFVIDNSGHPDETRDQVIKVIQLLGQDKFHMRLRLFAGFSIFFVLASLFYLFRPSRESGQ